MTTQQILIREATFPATLPAWRRCRSPDATHYAKIDPQSYRVPELAELVDHYRSMARRNPTSVVLVADEGGCIVGAAEVRLLAAPARASMHQAVPTAIIELAALTRTLWAAVGGPLMDAAEEWALAHGARRLQIDALARSRRDVDVFRKRDGFEVAGVVLTKDLEGDG